jgi:hypothetical protein
MDDKLKSVRERVVINETSDGGSQLMECFFLPGNVHGAYNLYDPEANLLAANVVSGQEFNFTVEGVHFKIHDFKADDIAASGKWKTHDDPTGDTGGSFQASSSGGADTDTDAISDVAPPAPAGAITMQTVTGTSDKAKLATCYFMQVGTTNTYNLYNKNGGLLASGLTNGNNFGFEHDALTPTTKINWSITQFAISSTAASGSWSNNDPSATAAQGGSFQASSSGTLDPVANAASASKGK